MSWCERSPRQQNFKNILNKIYGQEENEEKDDEEKGEEDKEAPLVLSRSSQQLARVAGCFFGRKSAE